MAAAALRHKGLAAVWATTPEMANLAFASQSHPDSIVVAIDDVADSQLEALSRLLKPQTGARPTRVVALITDIDAMERIAPLDAIGMVTPVFLQNEFSTVIGSILNACQADPTGSAIATTPTLPLHPEIEQAESAIENVARCVADNTLPGPMIPEMLTRFRGLLKGPVDFSLLADLAMENQTLAARLISMANSAYYWRGRQAKTVVDAITRLGENRTRMLILALATQQFIVGKDAALRGRISRELHHAFLVALTAQEIVLLDRNADAMETHAIGLFHNVGKVFLLHTLSLQKDNGSAPIPTLPILDAILPQHLHRLNGLVIPVLRLPTEAALLFDPAATSAHLSPSCRAVLQALWIVESGASRTGLAQQGSLERFMGLRPSVTDGLGPKLEGIFDAAERFRQIN
jgi:HDOD domain